MARSDAYRGRWPEIRRFVLERDGHLCQIRDPSCCVIVADTVDHVLPVALFGPSFDPRHLRAACGPCNRKLGHRLGGTISGHGRRARQTVGSRDW